MFSRKKKKKKKENITSLSSAEWAQWVVKVKIIVYDILKYFIFEL